MEMFMGYGRPDGTVGVRNNVIVITTTACANGAAAKIAKEVPDVVLMVHAAGCGKSGPEKNRFNRTITNLCKNPNNYAAIIVGLGCESSEAKAIAAEVANTKKPVLSIVIQDDGGVDEVARLGIKAAKEFVEEAKKCKREPFPMSKLILGTECGGSDALSGVTANPIIGYLSDWLIDQGGTSILTETTELIGTEEILAARAVSPEVGAKIRKIIGDTEHAVCEVLGPQASRIIARGNMEGGMSTIQEKALGCVRKGGSSPIQDVIDYAEPIGDRKGLVIMDGPGYDVESLTGMFASGAQIAVFSTGRGNPIGFPGIPVIKICSNDETFNKVRGDMDVNAGRIVTEGLTLKEFGPEVVNLFRRVVNGELTKSEANDQGGIVCIYSTTRSF